MNYPSISIFGTCDDPKMPPEICNCQKMREAKNPPNECFINLVNYHFAESEPVPKNKKAEIDATYF
jgi:hypothetical protein